MGYKQRQIDHTLFFKHTRRGKQPIFLVYVSDIIVIADDLAGRELLKNKLSSKFEKKDLGELKYFLGIEVAHSNRYFYLS